MVTAAIAAVSARRIEGPRCGDHQTRRTRARHLVLREARIGPDHHGDACHRPLLAREGGRQWDLASWVDQEALPRRDLADDLIER